MYKVEEIANFFIERGLKENNPVNPMKLQKMLYFSYGWYYAYYDKPLFKENIQAWKYGPVIEEIYHEVKRYGNFPITSLISKYVFNDLTSVFSFKFSTPQLKLNETDDLYSFLDAMWGVYSKYSAIALSNSTHSSGTPWETTSTKHDLDKEKKVCIDVDLIKTYFSEERKKMEGSSDGN